MRNATVILVALSMSRWSASAQESPVAELPTFTTRGAFVPTPPREPLVQCRYYKSSGLGISNVLAVVDGTEGQVVADIGCGAARHVPGLAQQVGAHGRVLARDIEASVIAALQAQIGSPGLTNVEAEVSAPGDVLLPAGVVDVALLCDVFHIVMHEAPETVESFLRSLFAGVKPGGVVVVAYFNANPNFAGETTRGGLVAKTVREFLWAGFTPGRRWQIGEGLPLTAIEFQRPTDAAAALPWWDLSSTTIADDWTSWLGSPKPGDPPLESSDPHGVFSSVVVDGEPAIRVSGEGWGVLATHDSFADYELELEFKWGGAIWPPLHARDSGVLYHLVGEEGAVAVGGGPLADPPGSGFFPRAFELQLTESDSGSFYCLGDLVADVESATSDGLAVWKRGGTLRSVGGSHGPGAVVKLEDRARPVGEWNRLQILCHAGDVTHRVNGGEVVRVMSTRRLVATGEEPLVGGRIALQSESAEIFFRRIRIRPFREAAAASAGR